MDNANKTESFLYYASNLKVLEEFPIKMQPKVNMAIIEYGAGRDISEPILLVDGQHIDLRIVLRNIFDNIDSEKRRYKNKMIINRYIYFLSRTLETKISQKDIKEYERSIKDFKKLAIEANKSDIKNIKDRVLMYLPEGYYKLLNDFLDEKTKDEMVKTYLESIKKNCDLTLQEYSQLESLVSKAVQSKQERQRILNERMTNLRVRR